MMKRNALVSAAVFGAMVLMAAGAEARQPIRTAKLNETVDQRVSVRFASATQPQAMPQPIADPLKVGAVAPGCAAPVPSCAPAPCVCCPTPCITYRHAVLDLGRLCRPKCCKPPVKLVLQTK